VFLSVIWWIVILSFKVGPQPGQVKLRHCRDMRDKIFLSKRNKFCLAVSHGYIERNVQ